jgi:hypothetical protein
MIQFCYYTATTSCWLQAQGSILLLNFCNVLENLSEDVEIAEFLRKVRFGISNFQTFNNDCQTAQTVEFPHTRTIICTRKQVLQIADNSFYIYKYIFILTVEKR